MALFRFFKQVVQQFVADDCPRMAAALSYYTVFSMAPLLVLLMLLASLFFESAEVQEEIQQQATQYVGPDAAQQVRAILRNASQPNTGSVAGWLSAAGLLLGASGVMGQLQRALNDTWGVKPDPERGGVKNFLLKRLMGVGMVLGLAFVLVVSLTLSTVISAMDTQLVAYLPAGLGEGAAWAIDLLLTLAVLTLLFAAIYKVMPDAQIAWRDVAVGALLTASLFVAGKFALGAYLGSKNMGSTFGAAGSLALILLWVYYSGMILLLGAEFTQVWASWRGREIMPQQGAVRLVDKRK